MPRSPLPRRLVVLLVLAMAGVALHQVAVTRMKAAVLSALGPRASVGELSASWSTIELTELRVRGDRAAGWPADDELRARRVRVVPDLRSLFSGPWRIASVEVEGAQLTLLRQRDGSLRVLPALLDRDQAPPDAKSAPLAGTALVVDRLVVDAGRIDMFDASVRRPPHRLQLEALAARIGPLHLPALDVPVAIDMKATLKGPQRDGRVTIAGTLTPATRDAQLDARAEGVDLVMLQPYLLKSSEAGVRRGTLDLSLAARVKNKQLHAPGIVTLTGLELSSGGGPLATFAGVPRQAVLTAMSRDGRIEVAFTLDGRLDDPSFSINEAFALRTAASLAKSLGVSLEGVVEGVGGVLKGLLGR